MWWLSAYPTSMPPAEALALRAEAAQGSVSPARAETLMAEAEALEARATQASSFAGRAGRLIAPVFQPLGLDWQLTVGVLTSFMAREVFVSTMAVLEGGAADPALDQGIIDRVGRMRRDDGTLLFTPATAASALVFFVLAMQCLPTLAVTRRESGSRAYAWVQFGYMSGVAYLAALAVHVALGAVGVT
jgi:ferrous iron transport protein B